MQKWVKNALIGAAAFVAYRGFKLWEMFNGLNWSFQSVRFSRPKLKSLADSYIMTINVKIHNPSSTTLWINSLEGYIDYDGYILGRYSMGKVRINAGTTNLSIELDLDPKYVATILLPDLINRKAPVMSLISNASFILGIKVKNVFKFNIKEYLPDNLSQVIFK
jgi:hypothetical protein